ncbi:MAG TPA: citrate synthase [Candidatus Eisenbacteria bacterium]|nr:citrate synthase [Candidatus Eisenbacteria bacterium]
MNNTQEILKIFHNARNKTTIPNHLYTKYDVKKGLRNEDGTGVVVGLTRICDVYGYTKDENGNKVDQPGQLYYRGFPINTLYQKVANRDNNGYEEVCFLLLNGYLPTDKELRIFKDYLQENYVLPDRFLSKNILKTSSYDMMNKIQRSILSLYSEDDNPNDPSIDNTLRQGLSIIATLPAIAVYCYQAKIHLMDNKSLIIHPIRKDLDLAESFLYLLRGEDNYSQEEVSILDLIMILHADHGIGNNSTFANLVVSSTQTDIYSSFTAAVGSLKGPRHGGANVTCRHMMKTVIDDIGLDASEEEMLGIIKRLIDREYFDKAGLVYGIGHAVYTVSDPRSEILKENAAKVAEQAGRLDELNFYKKFAKLACKYISETKNKNVCANVDFYSGFIYDMLQIPEELYTPLFVISRGIGWLAHNLEEKINSNRIIRPAGLYVGDEQ